MNPVRNKYLLCNYIFIFSVLTLLINDHFLKFTFSNWWTGKLSDIAGIVILPLLVAFLFPRLKYAAAWISGILFIFWKSPLSGSMIELYNKYSFIQTSRIIDYSDLLVLVLLPFTHMIITRIDQWHMLKIEKLHPSLLLAPTMILLMATSPPSDYYYNRTDGNLRCYNCTFTVDYSQEEIVEKLKKDNIILDSDTTKSPGATQRPHIANLHYYTINELVIDTDTLKKIDFTMYALDGGKTKIYFTGLQVSEDVSDWKLAEKLRKYYKKLLFKDLNSKLEK